MRMLLRLLAVVIALAVLPGWVTPALAGDGYTRVVDITFPTDPEARYTDTYDASRSGGRAHKATDLIGQKMWAVYAAAAGTICWIPGIDEPMPSYGYMITICGEDGWEYAYIHLNNDTPGSDDGQGGPEHAYAPGLEDGSYVERGDLIGWMGDSGNAEDNSPQLHFEITDPATTDPYGSHRVNPYFSLEDARARGDYGDGADSDEPTVRLAPVERVGGTDRVGTAIELARHGFPEARHVVIAPAGAFAEAAVAGPLAALRQGPLLTTAGKALDSRVAEEIRRLGADSATLVGDWDALSPRVETDLVTMAGLKPDAITRLAGEDIYATAAEVAGALFAGPGGRSVVVIASAESWPDALTGAYFGAVAAAPVLLVTGDGVPPATSAALREVTEAVVVGGSAVIPDRVVAEVAARVQRARRLAGPDRYGTATAIVDEMLRAGLSPSRIWAATGESYADALAAGPIVARTGELLTLIDGRNAGGDGSAEDWLRAHADVLGEGIVIGGTAAITDEALHELATRIG